MAYIQCIWDLDDDSNGNVFHIARHGLTKNDVEDVLADPITEDKSLSTGWPIYFGLTRSGERVAFVFEWINKMTVYPVTDYRID